MKALKRDYYDFTIENEEMFEIDPESNECLIYLKFMIDRRVREYTKTDKTILDVLAFLGGLYVTFMPLLGVLVQGFYGEYRVNSGFIKYM
jgi:hypothetical protein